MNENEVLVKFKILKRFLNHFYKFYDLSFFSVYVLEPILRMRWIQVCVSNKNSPSFLMFPFITALHPSTTSRRGHFWSKIAQERSSTSRAERELFTAQHELRCSRPYHQLFSRDQLYV